jgi:hypothetical protein
MIRRQRSRWQTPVASAAAGETALVWRQGFKPQLRAAMAGECAWIVDLLAGCPLSGADHRHPNLDFDAWLPLAVSTSLLLGVSQLPPPWPSSQEGFQ